jgi:glutamyl-tRNA synthetase
MMSTRIRVRFAPSPTGPLHLGGVRTALFNYLFAKKNRGTFILRIEDTDQTRYVPGAEDYIFEALDWCGLIPEEGPANGGPYAPYRQSERREIYQKYAKQLLESGHAYMAFDTPEELEQMRERMKSGGNPSPQYDSITRQYMKNSLVLPQDEVRSRLANGDPYVIRLKMPRNEEVKFEDLIRGWVSFQSNQLDDKVLMKADGLPTYHLANIVDDHLMEISHVIRGEEWLPSAPLHVMLYRAFGWEMPYFAHLPLILRPDGNGKLSKRDGDRLGFPVFPLNWTDPETGEKSTGFREMGFNKDAFLNMLALLGWNPGTEQEVFSMDEMVRTFSIERIGKSGSKFDFDKAKWFNQQYIKKMDDNELADAVIPQVKAAGYKADKKYVAEVCRLLKERVHFIGEIIPEGKYFFEGVSTYDEKTISKKWKPELRVLFEAIGKLFGSLNSYSGDEAEHAVKSLVEQKQVKLGDVMPLLRVILTGTMAGPPLFETAALLGRDEVVSRIGRFLDHANQ